jgi:hypothetical protein
MRTRRSHRQQERLYRAIGADLARAAAQPPEGYEADPEIYACPQGPYCADPECVAENERKQALRNL